MSDRLVSECAPPTELAREWPREVVEALQRIGVVSPLTCGQNKHGHKMGCDEPFGDPENRYKCLDCDVVFHRECARKHFLDSGDRAEKLRERMLSIFAALRRIAPTTLDAELLDGLEETIRR